MLRHALRGRFKVIKLFGVFVRGSDANLGAGVLAAFILLLGLLSLSQQFSDSIARMRQILMRGKPPFLTMRLLDLSLMSILNGVQRQDAIFKMEVSWLGRAVYPR